MNAHVMSIVETSQNDGTLIDVECQLSNNLPGIVVVGFASKAVDEAKERIRGAFTNAKLALPKKRIILNLAPADIPKDSTAFDVPMAVAIMAAAGMLAQPIDDAMLFLGELALDGRVRPIRGIIGKLLAGKKRGFSQFYIPLDNLEQAQLVPGISLYPIKDLRALYRHFSGQATISELKTNRGIFPKLVLSGYPSDDPLDDIIGQERAKRAIAIAASGGHNILLSGPPGTGKSMLAKAARALLPPMSHNEVLEVTQLHSLATNQYDQLVTIRPFRSPHHTASNVAIVGGGLKLKPGEISLSHHGILFLDELPEFHRDSLEALRQPLEDGCISVSRAKETAVFPANFMLIATANPCPCGNYGTRKICTCPPHAIARYQRKLSGPIIDRIDLFVNVDEVDHGNLLRGQKASDSSATSHKNLQSAIEAARERQHKRYGSAGILNANLSNRQLRQLAKLDLAAKQLLDKAAATLDISARSYMRTVKVARTIADLDSSDDILPPHISEALTYRRQEQPL